MLAYFGYALPINHDGEILMTKKRENIIELIRLTSLQSIQLDGLIPGFVRIAIEQHGKTDADAVKVAAAAKERINTDAFVEQFVPAFDAAFTGEEVSSLVGFYKSSAMKKFSTLGRKLLDPIYADFSRIILEVLEV
jgi:hypothetical protein